MNKEVVKIPPHQNAKVVAILIAASMIPFLIVMLIFSSLTTPSIPGPFFVLFLFMPIIYALFTYFCFGFACIVYNKLQSKIGGFSIVVVNKVE